MAIKGRDYMIQVLRHIWQWWNNIYLLLVWLEVRWQHWYKVYGEYSNLDDELYNVRLRQELEKRAQEEIWLARYHEWIADTGIYAFDGVIEVEDYCTSDSDCSGSYNREIAAWSINLDEDDPLPF